MFHLKVLQFSIHLIITRFLKVVMLSILQVIPNTHRILLGCIVINDRSDQLKVGFDEVMFCYKLKLCMNCTDLCYCSREKEEWPFSQVLKPVKKTARDPLLSSVVIGVRRFSLINLGYQPSLGCQVSFFETFSFGSFNFFLFHFSSFG